jgi:FKBP-type peptidyl-prolyl cis-trans isomerase
MYSKNRGKSAVLGAAVLLVLTGQVACSDVTAPNAVPCDPLMLQYTEAPADTVTAQNGLRYIELRPGTGATATLQTLARVHYTGYFPTGQAFESSCVAGAGTLLVPLGSGQYIPGFELGIVGMRADGVRRVMVPPNLGYGEEVGPLIFDIQLVSATGG